MINLIRAETFKVVRNRAFLWLNILMVFFSGFVIMLALLDKYGLLDRIENITVEVEEEIIFTGTDFLLYMIEAPELLLTYFYIAVLGTFFISSEYFHHTIKNLVGSGYARWQIYLAKLFVFVLSSLFIFLMLLVSSGLFGTLAFGVGEWPDRQSLIHLGNTLFLIVMLIASLVSIVMVFSTIATTNGFSLVVSLIAYIILNSGLNMLSHQYKIAETIKDYSVFNQFSNVFEQSSQTSTLIHSSLVAVLTIIVATIIGVVLFGRQDIS